MPGMYVEPLPILPYGKELKEPFVLRDAPLDISEGGGERKLFLATKVRRIFLLKLWAEKSLLTEIMRRINSK